jgi:hypothetical protein
VLGLALVKVLVLPFVLHHPLHAVVVVVLWLWEPAHIVRIDEVGHGPAVEIMLGHARVDEGFHPLG